MKNPIETLENWIINNQEKKWFFFSFMGGMIIITVLVIMGLMWAFAGKVEAYGKCITHDGKLPQLVLTIKHGVLFAECGSDGSLVNILKEYGGDNVSLEDLWVEWKPDPEPEKENCFYQVRSMPEDAANLQMKKDPRWKPWFPANANRLWIRGEFCE